MRVITRSVPVGPVGVSEELNLSRAGRPCTEGNTPSRVCSRWRRVCGEVSCRGQERGPGAGPGGCGQDPGLGEAAACPVLWLLNQPAGCVTPWAKCTDFRAAGDTGSVQTEVESAKM